MVSARYVDRVGTLAIEVGALIGSPTWLPVSSRLNAGRNAAVERAVSAPETRRTWVGRNVAKRLTGSRPRPAPAKRLSTWTMTREALTVGFDDGDGFLDRARGSDITRFRCAGRRFVSISHPDYVDHVLHEARPKYVKSNEYEPIRAAAGVNLVTDEGDSWAAHRGVLNPTFARRHLNGLVDLMIDPITGIADALRTGAQFDMHQTMV